MSHVQLVHDIFFFNDTATTEIYTLSLHDALPICKSSVGQALADALGWTLHEGDAHHAEESIRKMQAGIPRSEEHTSELQSPCNLVCRLLLEKKKHIVNTVQLHFHAMIRRCPLERN